MARKNTWQLALLLIMPGIALPLLAVLLMARGCHWITGANRYLSTIIDLAEYVQERTTGRLPE